jgi:ribosomal protein L32
VSEPVRYGSRYGSAALVVPHGCLVCGAPLRSARADYCSAGCKQRAYRLRQVAPPADDAAARATDLKRRQRLVAQTIYECPTCGERYLGERRCPDCNRFCRALGLGGACPHCDQPILVAELLGGEGVL